MPSGTGAVNLRNLPNVAYEINPQKFFSLTEKNEFPPVNYALPAWGNYQETQLLQVGVVSKLRIVFSGSVTTASTPSITTTFKWPYGLFSNITVSGNGQNNFISCSSYDLYLRQLIQNRAYVDGYTSASLSSILSAAGTANVQMQWEVPIAMDDTTLIGSLYAQSEATNLTVITQVDAQANLFTISAGTLTITGTVYIHEVFFDVPYAPDKPGTLVIPDLTVLHGLISNNNAVAGLGEVVTPLYRINGQLERLIFYCDNNNALVTQANMVQARLMYGGSTTPQNYSPMDFLTITNNQDCRDALPAGTWVIDLVKDNPARDQILLEGVTNLRLVTDFKSGFSPNAAAKIHFVQETLFA